jgi:hypothetical protein
MRTRTSLPQTIALISRSITTLEKAGIEVPASLRQAYIQLDSHNRAVMAVAMARLRTARLLLQIDRGKLRQLIVLRFRRPRHDDVRLA